VEGLEAVPIMHHVVARRVSNDPLPADTIILGRRCKVAYHPTSVLTIVGHRDPAIHLVPQRVSFEPTVDRGVELDVVGLGELRVRLDTQLRYALLEGRVIERPYHYLHRSSPEIGLSLIPAPFSTMQAPLTHELSHDDSYQRGV
jgi:hypothetical protein